MNKQVDYFTKGSQLASWISKRFNEYSALGGFNKKEFEKDLQQKKNELRNTQE